MAITSVKGYVHYASSNPEYGGNVIGLASNVPYERVYGFTVPNTGATQAVIVLRYEVAGDSQNLRCVINETDEMYTSATGISTDGVVGVYDTAAKTITFTVNKDMLGNRTFYAHIFAGVNSNACTANVMRTDGKATAETSGVYGGLVTVFTGSAWVQCIPYVRDGGEWKQCLGYAYNGSWKMGV